MEWPLSKLEDQCINCWNLDSNEDGFYCMILGNNVHDRKVCKDFDEMDDFSKDDKN